MAKPSRFFGLGPSEVRHVLKEFGFSWKGVVATVVVLGLFHLFTHAVHGWLAHELHLSEWLIALSSLVLLVLLLAGLATLIKKQVNRLPLEVVMTDAPPPSRCLIALLSPAGKLKSVADGLSTEALRDLNGLRDFGPWAMLAHAVAHHAPRLERLILVASRDRSSTMADGPSKLSPPSASCHDLELAREFFVRVAAAHQVRTTGEALRVESAYDLAPEEFKAPLGIDMEDVEETSSVLNALLQKLSKDKKPVAAGEVVLDITGGQKPATLAAALLALVKGRKFQYVSTESYKVFGYTIRVSSEEEHG